MRPATLLVLLALLVASAGAIIPIPLSDLELAQRPIIVIARWAKAKRTPHLLKKGDTIMKWETHTELVVERVLKGTIKPGVHKLLYTGFIGWADDGTCLNSASSSLHLTNTDVSKPNIWFLKMGQSWDEKTKTTT